MARTNNGLIFCDLDGVCCDFVGHVLALCGKREQDLIDEINKDKSIHPYTALENCVGLDNVSFWSWIESMGNEFWRDMPAFDWFDYLYNKLRSISDVHFLTSAPYMPSAYSGKAMWVENNVNKEETKKLIICNSKYKHYLAGPNRILIDDTKSNIEEWRATGNTCYYFPSLQFHGRHPTNDDIDDAILLAKETINV